MLSENTPLLEMRNIKKDFFGNQVLTDINLTLAEGEVLGLCGENGAGKSTLMKILFGMDVIRETGGYEGEILLNGNPVSFSTPFDALAAGIGMVHQEFSLIPGFTATERAAAMCLSMSLAPRICKPMTKSDRANHTAFVGLWRTP